MSAAPIESMDADQSHSVASPEGFDAERYRRAHPDVALSNIDPLQHWLQAGRVEERRGVRPNWRFPRFDTATYLASNPDVSPLIDRGEFDSAADHWHRAGRHEVASGARSFGGHFDEAAYLERRRDVAAAVRRGSYASGLDYWLCWGSAEDSEAGAEVIRIPRTRPPTDALSEEKQAFWKENGFVILEGVISPERCDEANRRIDEIWASRKTAGHPFSADIFLERADSRRVMMADAPDDARDAPYKINDAFMADPFFTDLALDPEVIKVLRWVLEADPCVVNSLNFERGSTQDFHTDTLYMPGPRQGAMTATWLALEDVVDDAGPLTYYPGSHQIPIHRFSTGSPAYYGHEFPQYRNYMNQNVDRLGLVPSRFLAKKGDVLIWHELLFHGGSPIIDPTLTRKSYVCHFWNAELLTDQRMVEHNGAYRLDRHYHG